MRADRFENKNLECYAQLLRPCPFSIVYLLVALSDWRDGETTEAPGNTGSTNSTSSSSGSAEESALVGLKELMSKVRLNDVSLNVQDAQFDAGILNLGNNQSIEFLSGTKLNVSGGLDNLTITGHASLGQLRLGGEELGRHP